MGFLAWTLRLVLKSVPFCPLLWRISSLHVESGIQFRLKALV